jgi:hypothetical protein
MSDEIWSDMEKAHFTLALVERCVRNTSLETLHAGMTPASATGDYSDVKIVTPYGEIAWNDLSRISDDEMKALMIEVTNKVYTFLMHAEDLLTLGAAARWNKPEPDAALLRTARRRAAVRNGASEEEAWNLFPPSSWPHTVSHDPEEGGA